MTPQQKWTPLSVVRERLEPLVSPHTGIVQSVMEMTYNSDDARLFNLGCVLADTVETVGVVGAAVSNAVSESRDAAWVAAVGEAVERYSSLFISSPTLGPRPAREIDGFVPAPESYALFHSEQFERPDFGYARFDQDTPVCWVRGESMVDGSPAWLPTQLVYLGRHLKKGEAPIVYSTSSGTALGGTRAEATLGALLETVERDAFMIAWKNRLSPARLDWSDVPELVQWEQRYLAPTRVEYAAYDLTPLVGIPTAVGCALGSGPRQPALSVGAASAPTMALATRKALREAFQTRVLAKKLLFEQKSQTYTRDYCDVQTFDDHVLLYARDRTCAEFLLQGQDVRSVGDVRSLEGDGPDAWVRGAVSILSRMDIDSYYCDITSPEVAQCGIHVARVICPQMSRLDVMHSHQLLGGERMYRSAHAAGMGPVLNGPAELNTHPHPFP